MRSINFLIIFCIGFYFAGKANDLTITNVQVTEKSNVSHWLNISFDLTIQNSWRINTGASNWNAAWVFIKYKFGNNGEWHHATLSIVDTEHFAPTNTTIDATSDGKGVFVFDARENAGEEFTLSRTGIKIRWNYGLDGIPDNTTDLYFKVFGIEMVYIPTGSFYLGSGGSEENHFYKVGNTSQPYLIENEDAIPVGTSINQLYYENTGGNGGDRNGPIPATFPKGFNGFYVMRYEISQEQYKDFLNTLTRGQQNLRTWTNINLANITDYYVMSQSASVLIRNGITCLESGHGSANPITFYCDYNEDRNFDETFDGQNIACNFLNWRDGLGYLDWAGLRPMTELEFEKACRGPNNPVIYGYNDYPWGSEFPTPVSLVINNDGEPGETASNTGNGLCNYGHDTNTHGPMRCGFAATTTTNKVQAGTSYYGVMDLAGNLSERCITVGAPMGRAFTGEHGDGELDASGNANVSNWPDVNGQSSRGGNFRRISTRMMVSTRTFGAYNSDLRYDNVGWRGARTSN